MEPHHAGGLAPEVSPGHAIDGLKGDQGTYDNSGRTVVLHLILNLEVGGLETLVVNLVKKTKRQGLFPLVCCLESKGPLADSLEREGIQVIALEKRPCFDFNLIVRLARLFCENRVTILHTHNWSAHLYGSLALLIRRVPVVVHTQHGNLSCCTWKSTLIRPLVGRLIDQFVGVSNNLSQFAKRSGWVPEKRVQTILNGIDLEAYADCGETDKERIRKEFGILPGARVVINVARLMSEKDHFTLFRAFRYVADRLDDAVMVIVGDGPLMHALKSAVSEWGMERCVRFAGMRTDVPAFLRAADIFVLSSITEGISISLLEAMAVGLPVVATDVGGNGEVVMNGETGILVSPQQPEQFANAILCLLQEKKLARKMGKAGQQRVFTIFSFDRMVTQYLETYQRLMTSKGLSVGDRGAQ